MLTIRRGFKAACCLGNQALTCHARRDRFGVAYDTLIRQVTLQPHGPIALLTALKSRFNRPVTSLLCLLSSRRFIALVSPLITPTSRDLEHTGHALNGKGIAVRVHKLKAFHF